MFNWSHKIRKHIVKKKIEEKNGQKFSSCNKNINQQI